MTTFTVSALVAPQPAPVNGLILGYARSAKGGSEATALQREFLNAYARRAFGRDLDGFHEDFRASGARMDRPGLDALMRIARTHQVAAIVVEDLDRVSRTMRGIDDFLTFCDRELIQLHSCWGGHHRSAGRARVQKATASVS